MGGPKAWEPVLEYLIMEFQVIVPTFPGYLAKDGRIKYFDKLYVDFLENIREQFELKQLNIIGLSMGGRTVINYALEYQDKVKKLILIDSVGIGNMSPIFSIPILKDIFSWLLRLLLSNPKNMIRLGLKDFVDQKNDIVKKNIDWFIKMMSNKVIRDNFSEILVKIGVAKKEWLNRLTEINLPTLILWSSEDKAAPVKWAYQLNSLIQNSKIFVLEGYRHMGIMEKPEFFAQKISEFLKA